MAGPNLQTFLIAVHLVMARSGTFPALKSTGLARTPPMGWMSWQVFRCEVDCEAHPQGCINEQLYMQMADAAISHGYLAAGYRTISVDDCWQNHQRSEEGLLLPDSSRFPSGMKALGHYMHARGLQFGIYSDAGTGTCMSYPGSKGYFELDAHTFAAWGVDYLKLDGCYDNTTGYMKDYPAMGAALQASGRDIVYSCSWPAYLGDDESTKPFNSMVSAGCHLWRNWVDIQCDWSVTDRIIEHWGQYNDLMAQTAGPGRWHDPDMLLIGAGCLSRHEEQTQMAIWSIVAAPLIMGNDLRNVSKESMNILLNTDAIAISQDPLGKMGTRLKSADVTRQVWSRPLAGGSVAVVLYNRQAGSPAGVAVVAEHKACSNAKAMGGSTGFGYSLQSCASAVAADSECSSGFFYYSVSYNGQCKCALDHCANRAMALPYNIYKLDPTAPPTGPNISVHFADVGLSGPVDVYDVWAGTTKGTFEVSYTAHNVSLHGNSFLRLTSRAMAVIVE
eukprot:TRINITY_DN87286_c0_g1_i1.p1 TRINITY_DN87286_c0_g1~~TRINITY_DN87286_c0_g1_i1.p1  ORF type:complete len:503 (-),score=63.71 TRINITY_DN87286_c0_g1_i1:211-1719(-)